MPAGIGANAQRLRRTTDARADASRRSRSEEQQDEAERSRPRSRAGRASCCRSATESPRSRPVGSEPLHRARRGGGERSPARPRRRQRVDDALRAPASALPPRDDAVAVRHHDQQPALVDEGELLAEEARVRLRLAATATAPRRGRTARDQRDPDREALLVRVGDDARSAASACAFGIFASNGRNVCCVIR